MKTLDDYLDDIEDVLAAEGECQHRASHEEDGIYDSVEHSLSKLGRIQAWRILYQLKQDTFNYVMEILRAEREKQDNNRDAQ